MLKLILTSMLLLSLQPVLAADAGQAGGEEDSGLSGAELTQQHCTRCHGDEMYLRDERQVKSLESLKQRAHGCNTMTGANLFEEDVAKIIDHLNSEFYHFER
ncbi:MAG: cytochrome c [Pseudomonadota bacterium]